MIGLRMPTEWVVSYIVLTVPRLTGRQINRMGSELHSTYSSTSNWKTNKQG